MKSNIVELSLEKLKSEDGVRELNRMLRELSDSGSKVAFHYGDSAAVSADAYASFVDGVVGTSTIGYRMPRSGSIVGHSCLVNVTTATDGDVTFEIRVNDSNKSSLELEFASAAGTGVASKDVTVARYSVPFSRGDIIQVFQNETTTMAWTSVVGFFEVIFDD